MVRKRIIAGNWKMNLTAKEAKELIHNFNTTINDEIEVYVFPSSIYLTDVIREKQSTRLKVGAQNAYPIDNGAFTGEVSMAQLKSIGCEAVLIGHSERRLYFNETNEFLKEKVDAALKNGLTPFFCCGESLEIREEGNYVNFVLDQIEASLFHLEEKELKKVVIAYEPIWAIGTGKTANAEQAEEMHAAIRNSIAVNYSENCAEAISILYGGSCNPSNAKALFGNANVDGGLIGGASLKSEEFKQLFALETWTILS